MRSGKGQEAAARPEADLRAEAGLPWMAHAVAVLPQMVDVAVDLPTAGLREEASKAHRHRAIGRRRLLVRKPICSPPRCVSAIAW
jgi:hypothetical protein